MIQRTSFSLLVCILAIKFNLIYGNSVVKEIPVESS